MTGWESRACNRAALMCPLLLIIDLPGVLTVPCGSQPRLSVLDYLSSATAEHAFAIGSKHTDHRQLPAIFQRYGLRPEPTRAARSLTQQQAAPKRQFPQALRPRVSSLPLSRWHVL